MKTKIGAIYEHGKLVPQQPLGRPEMTRVRVTIHARDEEHADWFSLSEASLLKTWDKHADDVYNELLMDRGKRVYSLP